MLIQESILRRTVSSEKLEQLRHLWQQMAEVAEAELITEADLLSLKSSFSNGQGSPECLRLLIYQQFGTLLVGTQVTENAYEISITFSPQAIYDFFTLRGHQLQHNPILRDRVQQLTQSQASSLFLDQFTRQLIEVLAPSADGTISSKYARSLSAAKVLHRQLEQERILNQITFQISQNIDSLVILKTAVEQAQRLLGVDRLVIYQLDVAPQNGNYPKQITDAVTYEARASDVPSLLNFHEEVCFSDAPECRSKYRQGFCLAVDDIETANFSPCLLQLMRQLEVRSKLVVPILVRGRLWGFLIAHQCQSPRRWQKGEIQFLRQVAETLAIAVHQAQTYKQLQEQKKKLERQVNQQTQELKEALMAAEAAYQSKSDFLGNMSHELRTPLTHVIGLSGTLLHWSKNGTALPLNKQQQYLQTVHDSGQQLLKLINNILDFSQINAGQSRINVSEVSLKRLAQAALDEIHQEADRQQIQLELDLKVEPSQERFWIDRERVQQILFHLLDNALKFTPAKQTVTLRVWRENYHAVFQVEDTGIGIAQEQLPLLFETFQQLEHSRQRTHGGAGLGLALTKQLVELLQGTIEVESTLGIGSLFTVRLPSQLELLPHSPATPTSRLSSGGGTIVLIEKDEELAVLICKLLTAAHYQVVWLIESATAVFQAELLQPKAIILDGEFPDAWELSQKLKQQATEQIKILLLSSPKLLAEQPFQKVVDELLLKPLQPEQLLKKVSVLTS